MPLSMPESIPPVIRELWREMPRSVLDIGCGFGLYGVLTRQYLEVFGAAIPYGERRVTVDAVEVYEPYITDLHRHIYDNIAIGNASDVLPTLSDGAYDVVLLLDVLEHFDRESGAALLRECRRIARRTIVNVPYPPGPQGTVFGNEHEAHVSEWDVCDFEPCRVLVKADALIVVMEGGAL